MSQPAVLALVACVISAALEGVLAGRGVRQYFASLRQPGYALPLWSWYIVGGLYYVMCFVVLVRILGLEPGRTRNFALLLSAKLMAANAVWNYLFFRLRSPGAAFALSVPYSLIAVGLLVCLAGLDRLAAWVLLPYLVYLLYANAWGYRLWQLNPRGTGRT